MFYFISRINGAPQNLSTHDTFSFANDSTKLNIFKPENRTDSDGVQVIIMAFQYKSGQYINEQVNYNMYVVISNLKYNFSRCRYILSRYQNDAIYV